MLQAKLKAVVATLLGFVSSLLAFYNANQNVTLKGFLFSLGGAVVTGTAVHQVTNKVK